MSKIIKTTVNFFTTTDGNKFYSIEDAKEHQIKFEIVEYLKDKDFF
jgi:hypothetical protein